MNALLLPSMARKNKSDSGEGNRDGDLNICQGKEADIAFFLASDKNKKDQKMFEAKYSIIARNWTISSNEPETQKQTKGMEIH